MTTDEELKILPLPGYILVQRIKKNECTKAGVFVPRQDQEETSGAICIHPGWYHDEFTQGDRVLVEPHCGTDFFWAGGDVEFTILPIERVLAKCEGTGKGVEWA